MTPDEIRKEAEKYADERFPAFEWDERDPNIKSFMIGYLAGARRMNKGCIAKLEAAAIPGDQHDVCLIMAGVLEDLMPAEEK